MANNAALPPALADFRVFHATDFVNAKTAEVDLASPLKSSPSRPLEPKPFIAKFEITLDNLLRMRRKVQMKIDDLEDAANASENARRRKLTELNAAVENVQSAFKSLEQHLSDVGKTAIRIGEQLETIDKQRRTASETKDLIYFFQDFNSRSHSTDESSTEKLTPEPFALEVFRNSGNEAAAQTASIARRLNAIVKEMGIPGTELKRPKAKENMEKFSEELETSVLDQFHNAYSAGDRATMNKCARILTELNGGTSCMQTCINQHEFFINQSKILTDDFSSSPNFGDGPISVSPKLQKLLDELKTAFPKEWDVISAVFPNATAVMQNFAQRVQSQIEYELSTALDTGDLFYLRTLKIVHQSVLVTYKSLALFDKEVIVRNTKGQGIGLVLDRCFDDLFVPYTDNDRYVDVECRCLRQRIREILSAFNTFVSLQAKSSKIHPTIPSLQAVGNMIMGGHDINQGKSKESLQSLNEPLPEAVGLPSVSVVLEIFSVHLETLERCRELSKIGDLARNVLAVFKVLIEECGRNASKKFSQLENMEIIQIENQSMNLLQLHFQTAVAPMLAQAPTLLRDAVLTKNEFMESVEMKLNYSLKAHLEVLQEWLDSVLAKQKKSDYKPKDEQTTSAGAATSTCTQICEYLQKVLARAEKRLDGVTRLNFLEEVGATLHIRLLDHIKKFVFTDVGGLILSRDLSKYYELIQNFRVQRLDEKFEMIREVGNLFIVKPENLAQVINGSYLSQIDFALLTRFLMCRADWTRVQKMGIFPSR
ncbi:Exocyst complex component 5 [Entophlyctis luteolus]|nr:Exocyst complex component 5 [Entophlyctis luteolus]